MKFLSIAPSAHPTQNTLDAKDLNGYSPLSYALIVVIVVLVVYAVYAVTRFRRGQPRS